MHVNRLIVNTDRYFPRSQAKPNCHSLPTLAIASRASSSEFRKPPVKVSLSKTN